MTFRPFEGQARQTRTAKLRKAAAQAPHAVFTELVPTEPNMDEASFGGEALPSTFTKGLRHDEYGFVTDTDDVDEFRKNINDDPATDFETSRPGIAPHEYHSTLATTNGKPGWRGWESPRTGHFHDVEGADADAIGMAPAPRLNVSDSASNAELAAEMAEVYAMAILRDVPFTEIQEGQGVDIGAGEGTDAQTALDVPSVLQGLNTVPHFATGAGAESLFTRRRLAARFVDPADYDVDAPPGPSTIAGTNIFRGSGPGAKAGPYISQFMLIGNGGLGAGNEAHPLDGYIAYGNQVIDQRVRVFEPHVDYMTNWFQWLDVQNGASKGGWHSFSLGRRFITTPRDLATYVRFDALYQAYLNACLILLQPFGDPGQPFTAQDGFSDQGGLARTPFASFGGPHVLSLVTEVATRCLKAARRQKFNYHRRARPEKIAGLLTVGKAVRDGLLKDQPPAGYGDKTREAVESLLDDLGSMLGLVDHHNVLRENGYGRRFTSPRNGDVANGVDTRWLKNGDGKNLLLAMAFPEGSPMHPAYAAGHATVAGGCVTMLKAFFKTVDPVSGAPVPWHDTGLPAAVPTPDGLALTEDGVDAGVLTVEGELNKLAANISIGRNMAGVHFYSDYYDSLRMGERIAVSILLEQLYGYTEPVEMVFRSFDGDLVTLKTAGNGTADVQIETSQRKPVDYHTWWYRHMVDPTVAPSGSTPDDGEEAQTVSV
ncbi:hypothetical protein [Citreimonas sp.]|uniref:hypothetical protein n=1 Tax=Citreimonas sp. TaxID=3036715 RepID=UPI0035C7FDC9